MAAAAEAEAQVTRRAEREAPDVADVSVAESRAGGGEAAEGESESVSPGLALALLRAATALLLEELKQACESVLVGYLDADNCAPLAHVAEACFAPRLHAACVALRDGLAAEVESDARG